MNLAQTSEACYKGLSKTAAGEVLQFKGWPAKVIVFFTFSMMSPSSLSLFLNYVSGFSIVAVCICSHQVKKTAMRDGFETSRIPSIGQEIDLIKCIFLGKSNIDKISDLTVSFVHSLGTVLPLELRLEHVKDCYSGNDCIMGLDTD